MLKIEDAQKLFQLTEGWIAILYKMLLAYFETNEVNELHEIQAIVKELFYEPLSDEIKAFLDCIAIFPDFTLELAEKMYKKEAGNLLSHLINNNHLIFYDKAHNTYRFHYLFYTCMREHFDRLQKSKKKKIFHTAGAYYEQQQQYKKAMAYYDLAESYDELMLCFEINRNRDLDSLDLNDMISYFQNCPIYIIKYHHMARLLLSLYLYSYNPVSYTHLDVYKRQAMCIMPIWTHTPPMRKR